MGDMSFKSILIAIEDFLFNLFLSFSIARAPSVSSQAPDPIANEILKYNNTLSFFTGSAVYTNGVSTIHKINQSQANLIALILEKFIPSLPMPYMLGCLAIESCLDPDAENKNTQKGGSNPDNNPMGYDEGLPQIKLRYLPDIDGVTLNQKLAFALNPNTAIPYFVENMLGKLKWATATIAANTSSVVDPRLNNKYLLATGAYNFGETGMLSLYQGGQFPSHCQQVADLEKAFAKALGLPSVT